MKLVFMSFLSCLYILLENSFLKFFLRRIFSNETYHSNKVPGDFHKMCCLLDKYLDLKTKLLSFLHLLPTGVVSENWLLSLTVITAVISIKSCQCKNVPILRFRN